MEEELGGAAIAEVVGVERVEGADVVIGFSDDGAAVGGEDATGQEGEEGGEQPANDPYLVAHSRETMNHAANHRLGIAGTSTAGNGPQKVMGFAARLRSTHPAFYRGNESGRMTRASSYLP